MATLHTEPPSGSIRAQDDQPRTAPEASAQDLAGKGRATASKPKKRFVGKSTGPSGSGAKGSPSSPRGILHTSVPPEILQDSLLNEAIAQNLPSNYQFEMHKTIWNIRKWDCKMVGLQMPEGLLMWACILSDIIERFTSAQTVILGDVTYGACCIDDYTALALGCDMLVHYGHSCLVPIDVTTIRTLYVFVEISIDSEHLVRTIRRNFPSNRDDFLREVVHQQHDGSAQGPEATPIGTVIAGRRRIEGSQPEKKPTAVELENGGTSADLATVGQEHTRLALVSTIQFSAALNKLKEDLSAGLVLDGKPTDTEQEQSGSTVAHYDPNVDLDSGVYSVSVPRSKPLSPGEILGCTAPRLKDVDAILYLADGRFHLEAIMIANPTVPAFRYDPYSKKLTREYYDHEEMRAVRGTAVTTAKASLPGDASQTVWGVVLGTLGRQGSLRQMEAILRQLDTYGEDTGTSNRIPYMPILLSELSPAKLSLFNDGSQGNITTFIQTSCPRLSIDWGYAFERPLLSPYEAAVVLGRARGWDDNVEDDTGSMANSAIRGVYPMDFYEAGSVWATSRLKGRDTVWPLQIAV
ncbi:Diphthamide biosynthesis protein 1 [Serendipita indica DSM 11827]|uniref:2-(3-amino-3-carboxypropyl)histidine synthase subunit 1 n=1 Tax=Serendipita indica (strain DSM 11827) TaxID=1109443 RepID=G4TPT4_SERID|nr:Diphthamide biosynthesis protein 1 [Serendipita indica DSM 11827]CCA73327.1 related to candidate tumor suppressor dph2l1 [Serendipita indica DSM 11827]